MTLTTASKARRTIKIEEEASERIYSYLLNPWQSNAYGTLVNQCATPERRAYLTKKLAGSLKRLEAARRTLAETDTHERINQAIEADHLRASAR